MTKSNIQIETDHKAFYKDIAIQVKSPDSDNLVD